MWVGVSCSGGPCALPRIGGRRPQAGVRRRQTSQQYVMRAFSGSAARFGQGPSPCFGVLLLFFGCCTHPFLAARYERRLCRCITKCMSDRFDRLERHFDKAGCGLGSGSSGRSAQERGPLRAVYSVHTMVWQSV
jgi:hypothetical protein